MKILRLHFKNLNSLVGNFVIDFNHPSYRQEGLFLISGPTGAGKSTILDAISLALFGRTPRLKVISKSINEIMSKGCGECLSEVEFSTLKGAFRCKFYQRRAHCKADGSLQAPIMELVDLQENKIISDKISIIEKEIEKISGMNYERFTRSIMLAQGEFAKFLQSKDDEKATLLEQITGSAIYSEISSFVQKKFSEKDNEYKQKKAILEAIELPDVEQINLKKNTVKLLHEKSLNLEKELKCKKDELNHKISLNKCLFDIEDNHKQYQQLQKQISEFTPLKEKFLKAQKALEILEQENTYLIALNHLKNLNASIEKYKNDIPSFKEEIIKQQAIFKAQNLYKKLCSVNAQNIFAITELVKDLDIKLDLKLQELNKIANRLEKDQKLRLEKIDIYKQQKQKIKDKLKDIINYQRIEQNINKFGPYLSSELSSIKLQLQTLRQIPSQIKNKEKSILNCKKIISQTEHTIKLQEETQKHIKTDKEIYTAQEKELLKAKTICLNGKTIEFYQQKKVEYSNYAKFIAVIESYEQTRSKLIEGEPCPLCGSRIHPYCKDELPQKDQTQEKLQKIEDILSKLQNIDNKLENNKYQRNILELKEEQLLLSQKKLRLDLNNNQELLDEFQKEYRDLYENQQYLFQKLSTAFKEHNLEDLDLNAQDTPDLLDKKLFEYKNIQNIINELLEKKNELQEEHKITFNSYHDLIIKLKEEKKQYAYQKQQCIRLQEQRYFLLKKSSPESLAEKYENILNEALNKQHKTQTIIASQEARFNHTLELIENLSQQISKQEITLHNSTLELKKAYEERGFISYQDFLDAKITENEFQNLKAKDQKLKSSEDRLKGQAEQLQNQLRILKNNPVSTSNISDLENIIRKLEQENNDLHQKLGALKQELNEIENKKTQITKEAKLLEQLRQVKERYGKLNALIGSADGHKFRNFAQGITFEIMIQNANKQLMRMSDRYLLQRDKNSPLSLNVIDYYEASAIRSTANLSGGESFIISLALALGLSQMSRGQVQVDSLFLDEGFGTLDEKSLNMALNSLAALHQENKLIGIISHVQELKNNISTQIIVKRLSGAKSTLIGPGIQSRN